MLIVGRAVAGAGASAIFSGGMTIVGFTVPLRKRPIYIAILSSMFGISSVIGPLLGGAFTDRLTWRWCFWVRSSLSLEKAQVANLEQINLPFGAVAIGAVWFFFQSPTREDSKLTTKQKIFEIDLLGAFLLICAIVCLLLALQWGGFTYPWRSSKVWGLLIGFVGLIALFILQQFRRGERATIPPRIFGQRTVLWASLYTCFLNMSLCKYPYLFYSAITDTKRRHTYFLSPILLPSYQRHLGGGIRHSQHPLSCPHHPFLYRRRRRRHSRWLVQTLHDSWSRNFHRWCRYAIQPACDFWTGHVDWLPSPRGGWGRGRNSGPIHRDPSSAEHQGHADRKRYCYILQLTRRRLLRLHRSEHLR